MRFDDAQLAAALAGLATETPTANGIGARLRELAESCGERTAVVDADDAITFADLDAAALRAARVLSEGGVTSGGRVAILLPNGIPFVIACAAAWKLGACPVPISHRLPAAELDALLELSAPAVVIDEATWPGLADAARSQSAEALPDVPAAPWKIIGSGGSTGRPKLIVDPGAGPLRAGVAGMFGMRPGGVELVAGPMYHNGPFAWGFIQLLAGGTIVFGGRFDPEGYLATIERHRVTWSFVVPTMLHRLMALPAEVRERYDISSLEVVLHSAAPCPPWLKEEAIAFFGADRVWEYYGAAEVPGTMIRGDDWLAHPPSVGRPLPGLEVVIRDDAGERVPNGEIGEIWLRPPGGPAFDYVGAERRVDGGLVSVGDLGWLDADGYLYISDRRTDLIISGGANVYPAEVEGALLRHSAVADAAVVGLPHPDWGQVVHAIVEPRPSSQVTEAELAAHCRENLAPYKVPKSFEMVASLPRDPSGKLRRSALRDERAGAPT